VLNVEVGVLTSLSCREIVWHIWFSYSWEHLDRLLYSAKKCVPTLFECTYLQSTFFIMLETSLLLLFIDCRYILLLQR